MKAIKIERMDACGFWSYLWRATDDAGRSIRLTQTTPSGCVVSFPVEIPDWHYTEEEALCELTRRLAELDAETRCK